MAKTPSHDLFTLIRSLNKNEKGYVKKFSFKLGDGDRNFLKLFDAIDRQKVYNENHLRKEKFFSQLPRMKSYLYEHILTALDAYYSRKNPDQVIRKILGHVYVLFEKGLYDQCRKQLFKAKQLAIRFEKFSQLLEIIEWEDEILVERLMLTGLDSFSEEKEKVLSQIRNITFYRKAYEQVSKLYGEIIYTRTKQEEKKFEKIISQEKLSDVDHATSLSSKILFYKIFAKYYAAIDDRHGYLRVMRKAVDLTETSPFYFRHNVMQYIKLLNNLMATLSEHEKEKEYQKYHARLKKAGDNENLKSQTKTKIIVDMRILIRDYFHSFNHGDFKKAFLLSKSMEKMLEERKELLSETHRIMFMYQVAYISFINEDFKRALVWSSAIIGLPYSPDKIFFLCQARLLHLAIQVELENTMIIRSLLQSNKRFFEKHNRLHTLENFFFDFIKIWEKAVGNKNVTQAFSSFHHQLSSLPAIDKKMFDYFNFKEWCAAKINKTGFAASLQKEGSPV